LRSLSHSHPCSIFVRRFDVIRHLILAKDSSAAVCLAQALDATALQEFRHLILANDCSAAVCIAQALDATVPSEECCRVILAIDSLSSVLCQCASVASTCTPP